MVDRHAQVLVILAVLSALSLSMLHQSLHLSVSSNSILQAHVEEFLMGSLKKSASPSPHHRNIINRTIAYAITLTDCSSQMATYMDGAAVLAYSIHRNSIRHTESRSKYDYKLYAFVHPDAANCSESLSKVGYEVQVRPTPINVEDIRGTLKEFVHGASCCGAKEFLKLYVYSLLDHPVAVHLDTDMLLLQPLDDLFDAMLEGPQSPARSRVPTMWLNDTMKELPSKIDAFFTRDYNMMVPGRRTIQSTAVQGGFIVIRPNMTILEAYKETILEGDYLPGPGWGASKKINIGGFYGAPQIQGLCAYFFGHIHPESSVELNRCKINNMADSPYSNVKGQEKMCRTHQDRCEDCREANFQDVKLVHFTLCSKPWKCRGADSLRGANQTRSLCVQFHSEWFWYRAEMEAEWIRHSKMGNVSSFDALQETPEDDTEAAFRQRRKPYCQKGDVYNPIQYPARSLIS